MNMVNVPFPTVQSMGTLAERRAAGKALRKKVARSSHAEWSPAADHPDPVSLLEEQNRMRFAHLVPIRFERMSVSPFTFLRGTAVVMAGDLASTPVSGIQVQLCGDAHLNNFGIYATLFESCLVLGLLAPAGQVTTAPSLIWINCCFCLLSRCTHSKCR